MKMLYGKPIAQHILDKVRDTIYECQIEPEMVVYCANPDEPYYKGILKDAKFCGIKVRDGYLSDSCGAISDSEHYIPSRNNLDGGEYTSVSHGSRVGSMGPGAIRPIWPDSPA